MPKETNCEHQWLYNIGFDGRARRICSLCLRKQVGGHTEKNKWFDSYFAVLHKTDKVNMVTEEQMLSNWSKEEIKLPL